MTPFERTYNGLKHMNRRPRALIVEDESSAQELLRATMSRGGIDTLIAKNGAEGLYHFLSETPIDLVILDIIMPEVGGEDFLKTVEYLHKGHIKTTKSKIIVYSAMNNSEELQHYSGYECVHSILQKPAGIRAILTAAQSILSASGFSVSAEESVEKAVSRSTLTQ